MLLWVDKAPAGWDIFCFAGNASTSSVNFARQLYGVGDVDCSHVVHGVARDANFVEIASSNDVQAPSPDGAAPKVDFERADHSEGAKELRTFRVPDACKAASFNNPGRAAPCQFVTGSLRWT